MMPAPDTLFQVIEPELCRRPVGVGGAPNAPRSELRIVERSTPI